MRCLAKTLQAWLALSRPPFHSVGLLPFMVGNVLARHGGTLFRWDRFGLGALGVVTVMLATYFAGEYWDQVEDELSMRSGASHFSGGSRVVQRGLLSPRAPLWASLVSVSLALAVGVVLRRVCDTGPWTIPLGLLGLFGGWFYSAKPVRWVSRGWGELWIAFCYGWLPVAVGYYLQAGAISPAVHWVSAPIGLTIFNVILLNEFPDYAADLAAGKANLTARLGCEAVVWLYVLVSTMASLAFLLSVGRAVPSQALVLFAPVLMLSALLLVALLRGRWQEPAELEWLCAANLLVNLGTSSAYLLALMR